MLYCENCNLLYEGDACPDCGNHDGREPRDDDFCFLLEKESMWSEMLADVLKQSGIPSLTKSVGGAGLAMFTSPLLESFRVYVPYARYEEARDIADGLFNAPVVQEEDSDAGACESEDPDA